MGAAPSLHERVNLALDEQGRGKLLINFALRRSIFAGDVGMYRDGAFVPWTPPPVCRGRAPPLPSATTATVRAGGSLHSYAEPVGDCTYFCWGDLSHSNEFQTQTAVIGEVHTRQSFRFGGGEALLLYGNNSKVDLLTNSFTENAERWLELEPDLVVVEQCVRFSPCVLAVQSKVTQPHTLTVTTHTNASRITERIDVRHEGSDPPAHYFDDLSRRFLQTYAADDYFVPWIRLVRLRDICK